MKLLKTSLFIYLITLLSACQSVTVAPYDAQVRNLLVRSWVKVEMFWQTMQAQDAAQRQFAQYSRDYRDIEVDLHVLLKLNQMRPDNDESIKQSENLLKLWQDDAAKHREKDGFKDFLLKRRIPQYQRVFDAMLKAEDAKDM